MEVILLLEQVFSYTARDSIESVQLKISISELRKTESGDWAINFCLEGMMPESQTIVSPYPFQCLEIVVTLLRNFLEAHIKLGEVRDDAGNFYHNPMPYGDITGGAFKLSDAFKNYMNQTGH